MQSICETQKRLKNETKQTTTIETSRDTNKSQISSSSLFRNFIRSNHLQNSDTNTNVPAATAKSDSNDFHQLNNLLGLANVALEIRDSLKND